MLRFFHKEMLITAKNNILKLSFYRKDKYNALICGEFNALSENMCTYSFDFFIILKQNICRKNVHFCIDSLGQISHMFFENYFKQQQKFEICINELF